MERIGPAVGATKPHTWAHHVARYTFACRYSAQKDVLDAGCGAGYGADMLLRNGRAKRVVGLEVDPRELEVQGARGLGLVRADAMRLPFRDESFDLVTAFEVIEHLDSPAAALVDIRRVLRRGGAALISTPRRALWQRRPTNPYHKVEFALPEFRQILTSTFDSCEVFGQYFDYVWTELPPSGVGLRTVLRHVAMRLARLNRIEHLRRMYDVMPVRAGLFVPKYMVALCTKAR